jgi:hypothetical protein
MKMRIFREKLNFLLSKNLTSPWKTPSIKLMLKLFSVLFTFNDIFHLKRFSWYFCINKKLPQSFFSFSFNFKVFERTSKIIINFNEYKFELKIVYLFCIESFVDFENFVDL